MKICFVIPPSGFLLDERVFPSLGVLKVAAAVEAYGHDVSVCDCSGMSEEAIGGEIRNLPNADVFGLTATMPQMPMAAKIAHLLRLHHHGSRVILGGPHATLLHSSAKRGSARAVSAFAELKAIFDVIVCGDGEKAVIGAIDLDPQEYVIDADDPASTLFLTKADLTNAPLPARHLIDLPSYKYSIDGHPTASLIAQLGCPFGCHFCGGRRSPFLRRVRTRTPESVIAEVKHLHVAYGYTGFMFLDDELNVNKDFMTLLDRLIALQQSLGVEFRLRGLLKSELLTLPMARRMYEAGFRQVLVGFESGSDRMLTNMNKHATVDNNTLCMERLTRADIKIKALMSFGHPGESEQSVRATEDWLLMVQPDDFDVTIITVYPGTPYYDDAVLQAGGQYTYTAKNGDRLHQFPVDHLTDVNFYKGVPGEYRSLVYTDHLTATNLVEARDAVEADVRAALKIPYPTAVARDYEHSMGCH